MFNESERNSTGFLSFRFTISKCWKEIKDGRDNINAPISLEKNFSNDLGLKTLFPREGRFFYRRNDK